MSIAFQCRPIASGSGALNSLRLSGFAGKNFTFSPSSAKDAKTAHAAFAFTSVALSVMSVAAKARLMMQVCFAFSAATSNFS